MNKAKKCKGTGKAINYGCGSSQIYRKYGLGLTCRCFSNWLLNSAEGKETLKKTQLRASVKVKKEKNREIRDRKESIIDYSKKLQTKINEIVRLIDIGQPCLARGHHAKQIHAGHVYSRGSSPTIKFNLHNIHRQSAQSNHFQNEDGLLREGLVKEYGLKYFEYVSSLRQTEALQYSNEEFKVFYGIACKIAIELRKTGGINNKEQRLQIRTELNKRLGIYK